MPYIGKTPLTGAYQLCDTITTSATATYNLTVGGSAVIPGSANNCIVSLNGVVQAPVGAFTVSGSTITFASALTSSDVIDFILILGNVFDIGTPTNGAVTNSSLNSNVITGQTAETTVAGGDLVLLYDDSASALRKMTRTNFVSGLNNAPAFLAYSNTNPGTALVANTATKVIFDAETFDTDSAYSTATGLFTVPSDKAGKYFCLANIGVQANLTNLQPYIYKNSGTSATEILRGTSIFASAGSAASVGGIFDLTVGDTLSVYVIQANTQGVEGVTLGRVTTYFCAYRLIGV
jgi:hypothetical protein